MYGVFIQWCIVFYSLSCTHYTHRFTCNIFYKLYNYIMVWIITRCLIYHSLDFKNSYSYQSKYKYRWVLSSNAYIKQKKKILIYAFHKLTNLLFFRECTSIRVVIIITIVILYERKSYVKNKTIVSQLFFRQTYNLNVSKNLLFDTNVT